MTWHYDTPGDCVATNCSQVPGQLATVDYPLPGLEGQQRGRNDNGYDTRGQLIFEGRLLAGVAFETRHAFDNVGRIGKSTYPDGREVVFNRDGLDRVRSVPGFMTQIDFDERGLLASRQSVNGIKEVRSYDALARLASITLNPSDALQDLHYTRNRSDSLTEVTDMGPARGSRPSLAARYSYDAWYRVLRAESGAMGAADETETVGYDLIDNIVSRTSTQGGSTADIGDFGYSATQPNASRRCRGLAEPSH